MATTDPVPQPADVLAARVLAHIDRRSKAMQQRLEQLGVPAATSPEAITPAQVEAVQKLLHDLRRMRASLALVDSYLLERRRELRARRAIAHNGQVPA
ncbi:MAG: hypothetical protein ACLGHT_09305 [Acidimicrobiia bacterium]|jgi:hypothetical protein